MAAIMAAISATAAVVFFFIFVHLFKSLVLNPKRLRLKLRKQGIDGPPSSNLLLGNVPEIKKLRALRSQSKNIEDDSISHDWPSRLLPHLEHWRNLYGPNFVYSSGTIQMMCVTGVELVKEIGMTTSLSLGKPVHLTKDRGPLLGHGILASSGPIWVHQRKTIAPPLYLEKVKDKTGIMVESVNSMLKSWETKVEKDGGQSEIDVDAEFRTLTADIISKACFGKNYYEGKEIFQKVRTLQVILSKESIGIPGLRNLPTKKNREVWKLEKAIKSMILEVAKERTEQSSHEQDLLQIILEGAKSLGEEYKSLNISPTEFIVDNCKSIYFAGQETTAMTASWCLMLLAKHPDWQARVRSEVLQCLQDRPDLDVDTVKNMKTLTMVIQETLRLYPPGVFVPREALEDIRLKNITIPKGTNIQIPISMLHQDTDLWGPSARSFDPQRFSNGILGACKNPQVAFIPFGVGSHVCAGQHFAMVELKVILSLILSRVEFSLSPSYKHSPTFSLVVEPQNGVFLYVRKLQSICFANVFN